MKVSYFKEQMSGVNMLLWGWRRVTYKDLNRRRWIYFMRTSAMILARLADELERDIAKQGE